MLRRYLDGNPDRLSVAVGWGSALIGLGVALRLIPLGVGCFAWSVWSKTRTFVSLKLFVPALLSTCLSPVRFP